MTEVKVAILGASGWMGKTHTMAYQSFPHFFGTQGGTARVVALVEANPAAARDLAYRAPDAKILGDWRDAVNDPDVDLIDICLPDNLHYDVAKAALLAGKHVYCEKPFADTAAQARELADKFGYVEPHLWTGVGRARSGCGAALVGSTDQVMSKIEDYQKMGIRSFIFSGYPHIDECISFGQRVLPNLKTVSLPEAYGRVPGQAPATPLAVGERR